MRRASLRGLAAPAPSRPADQQPSRRSDRAQPAARNLEVAAHNPGEGWLSLVAISTPHSRKMVGRPMRQTLHAEIAFDALNRGRLSPAIPYAAAA